MAGGGCKAAAFFKETNSVWIKYTGPMKNRAGHSSEHEIEDWRPGRKRAIGPKMKSFFSLYITHSMIGKKVLIRSYASGVHFGTLQSETFTPAGKVVTLTDSRRIHYWQGAASLSQVALEGINSGRVAMALPAIEVVNVIETIPLSDAAITNLENQPVWKV